MNLFNRMIFIFIGAFCVCFILYNRLLKERMPKEFSEIAITIKIIMILALIIILVIHIIKYYQFALSKQSEKNRIFFFFEKYYNKSYNPINIISNSLKEFDIFMKTYSPYYNERETYVDITLKNITLIFLNKKQNVIFVIVLLRLLPNLLVCLCLFIDFFYKNKFFYFYKSLWLLIFPLIVTYIIYSIKVFIESNLAHLNNILLLKIGFLTNKPIMVEDLKQVSLYEWQEILLSSEASKYICSNNLTDETKQLFKDDIISAKYCLEYSVDYMKMLFLMDYFLDQYDYYKKKIEIPFNIIKYIIYLIIWLNISL